VKCPRLGAVPAGGGGGALRGWGAPAVVVPRRPTLLVLEVQRGEIPHLLGETAGQRVSVRCWELLGSCAEQLLCLEVGSASACGGGESSVPLACREWPGQCREPGCVVTRERPDGTPSLRLGETQCCAFCGSATFPCSTTRCKV